LILLAFLGACRCNRGAGEWDEERGEFRQSHSHQYPPGNLNTPATLKAGQFRADYSPRGVRSVLSARVGKTGALRLIGVRHTRSIDDPQIEVLKRTWQAYKPTLAIYEGLNKHVADAENGDLSAGEPSYVRYLASRGSVPAETMEPTRAQQVRYLLKSGYSVAKIKAFYVMRRLSGRGRGEAASTEVARQYLVELNKVPGLDKPPLSTSNLIMSIRRIFPQLEPWWSIPRRWFNPRARGTGVYTNLFTRKLAGCRNMYMVDTIVQRVREGHRVYAVVGAGHVPTQEEAFRKALAAGATSSSPASIRSALDLPDGWPVEMCTVPSSRKRITRKPSPKVKSPNPPTKAPSKKTSSEPEPGAQPDNLLRMR